MPRFSTLGYATGFDFKSFTIGSMCCIITVQYQIKENNGKNRPMTSDLFDILEYRVFYVGFFFPDSIQTHRAHTLLNVNFTF